MEIKKETLDLGSYRIDGKYEFDSRTRGIAVRTRSNIDQLIQVTSILYIGIPKQVVSISKQFWKELLGNAIMDLGKEEFNRRVKIIPNGRYLPDDDVKQVVDEITAEVAA